MVLWKGSFSGVCSDAVRTAVVFGDTSKPCLSATFTVNSYDFVLLCDVLQFKRDHYNALTVLDSVFFFFTVLGCLELWRTSLSSALIDRTLYLLNLVA